MSMIEIVSGAVLILAAVIIIAFVLLQDPKGRGLSGAIMGGSADMMGARGATNEAKMANLTKVFGVIFAVVCLAVCIISGRLG